ncbi:MAG: hypothetical protein K0S98_1247 [Propionibacteriaceae bacterium]|nr:hypothetical protein [Propionibacteriaceae bacterium]
MLSRSGPSSPHTGQSADLTQRLNGKSATAATSNYGPARPAHKVDRGGGNNHAVLFVARAARIERHLEGPQESKVSPTLSRAPAATANAIWMISLIGVSRPRATAAS